MRAARVQRREMQTAGGVQRLVWVNHKFQQAARSGAFPACEAIHLQYNFGFGELLFLWQALKPLLKRLLLLLP